MSKKIEAHEELSEYKDTVDLVVKVQERMRNETKLIEKWRQDTGHNDITYPDSFGLYKWADEQLDAQAKRIAELEGAIKWTFDKVVGRVPAYKNCVTPEQRLDAMVSRYKFINDINYMDEEEFESLIFNSGALKQKVVALTDKLKEENDD